MSDPSALQRLAEVIAREAHAGQKDKQGDDYIHHVERVVALVSAEDAKAVAWLHDVLEDSDWMPSDFDEHGIPLHVTEAVVLLSRNKAIPYKDYIAAIAESGNQLAIAVKVADLRDHLQPGCPVSLRPRYQAALQVLDPLVVATVSALQRLIAEMRQRESDLFYSQYPRAEPNEAGRAAALKEVQTWREKLDALLVRRDDGAIREAFEEGFALSKFNGSISAAWERSEARQAAALSD